MRKPRSPRRAPRTRRVWRVVLLREVWHDRLMAAVSLAHGVRCLEADDQPVQACGCHLARLWRKLRRSDRKTRRRAEKRERIARKRPTGKE